MPQYLSPGVYVEEVEAGSRPIEGVGTAVAAFVGMAQAGPLNTPTLVTNWTQFTTAFGDFMPGSFLAHAVYGFFQNGGGAAYIVRIGSDDAAATPAARAELPGAGDQSEASLRVTARSAGGEGNDISVEVVAPTEEDAPEDRFTFIVRRGDEVVETFENVTAKRTKENVATVVNAQSQLVRVEEVAGGTVAERVPQPGVQQLSGGGQIAASPRVSPQDYVGNSADRTGFGGLEAIDDVTIVIVPDIMAAYQNNAIDADGVKAIQLGMIAHCEQMGDRLAILDPPPGLNAQQIKEWRVDLAGYDSNYAALYWPWIKVFDPASGENVLVPPGGHMAGIWSRTDGARGVHKAPANEVVRGVIDLELNISRSEHDFLNPEGINAIRAFPGRGIRVWGARTLSSDPAWRYINVRRLFNYVEQSILGGTQWVVFEPNDMDLWGRIRRTITAFLYRVWLDGALFGATPEQAFYVKCDEETNPQEVIEAGQVVTEIGICPVKPAEFVVFRLAQLPSGTSAVNE